MHDQDASDADDVFCICLFVGQVISSDVGTGNWGWSTPRGDQHKMASTQETFFLPYFLIFFIIEEYWDQSPKLQKYYRWLGLFRHYREILLPLWNIMGNITKNKKIHCGKTIKTCFLVLLFNWSKIMETHVAWKRKWWNPLINNLWSDCWIT